IFFKFNQEFIQVRQYIILYLRGVGPQLFPFRQFMCGDIAFFPHMPKRLIMPMGSLVILHKILRRLGMTGMGLHSCLFFLIQNTLIWFFILVADYWWKLSRWPRNDSRSFFVFSLLLPYALIS